MQPGGSTLRVAHDDDDALPYQIELELSVTDREVIAELLARDEGRDRDQFALAALRVGVLALRQARGQIDSAALKREGDQLLGSLQTALTEHRTHLNQHLTGALKEYFDPESGRFSERVDRLLRKDGELEMLLARKLTGDDSELGRMLLQHMGTDSPLLKILSPDESAGLLGSLRDALADELQRQRERVLAEFSLDNKEGALARLVGEMTDHNGKLRDDLQGQIDQVVREFSLDDEASALSRLVRQVDNAQRRITSEFSLDNEQSALSRMTRQVESTNQAIARHLTLDDDKSALFRLKRELLDVLKGHEASAQAFQEQVRETLAAMQARRAEAAKSTRHGAEFEHQVCEVVQAETQRSGDVFEPTGATTGLIKNCKVGDAVVQLGSECAAAGARVVVEAKEDASCTLARALAEIETARKNRDAQAGLFVYSARTAPAGLEPLSRHGADVVVVWDADDMQSDLVLKLGLSVARALCIRQALERAGHAFDFVPLDQAVLEIEKQAGKLEEIAGWATTIRGNSDKILDRVRISRDSLIKQTDRLQTQVEALKRQLTEGA